MSDLISQIADDLGLTTEERTRTIPSGKTLLIASRVHWAKTYLKQAGLLEQPKRAFVKITSDGLQLLTTKPSQIGISTLRKYPKFLSFYAGQKSDANADLISMEPNPTPEPNAATPEEQIEQAASVLDVALRDALLQRILESSPTFFEQLILDLLIAMGYGGSRADAAEHIGKSGDGGVDGVINEDRLGLDRVYVQAKRYAPDSSVGAPSVQSFIGALVNRGADKGVMISTSSFTNSAKIAAKSAGSLRLVLIDGAELSRLMTEFQVGVRVARTLQIKRIDLDYFDQETSD